MSAQEITVAAQQKLPVVFLVLNDSVMGMVMHGQRLGNQMMVAQSTPQVDCFLVGGDCGGAISQREQGVAECGERMSLHRPVADLLRDGVTGECSDVYYPTVPRFLEVCGPLGPIR